MAEKFAAESGIKAGDMQNANQGIVEINSAVDFPDGRPEKPIGEVRVATTIA